MRKLALITSLFLLPLLLMGQDIPESKVQPFYGVRHFVSMNGADTLSVSYENGRVNFRSTDSVVIHKMDYSAFFSGLFGDTVTYSFPYNDTISLGAGQVRLHDNDYFRGALQEHHLEPANLYIAPDELTYVVATYNSGNPIYSTTTDVLDISESDVVPVYTVYRQNGNAYVQGWYDLGDGLANKLHQRHVFIQRVERQSGLIIDTLNTRNVQLTGGIIWRGGQQNTLDDFNSLDDSLYFYSYDGTNWNYQTTEEINRTNYQTPTGLAATGNNRYVVNWLFRGVGTGPTMFYVVGTENYLKLQDAEASQIPANLPNIIQKFGFPVGRIIIEKSATEVTEINSYFDKTFTQQVITEHNNLGGLQGGVPGQYYHLTSAQVTKLNGIEEGAEVNVNADWNATTGDAQILNKPDVVEFSDTVATIATKYDLDTLTFQGTNYTFGNGLTESGGNVELGDPSIPSTIELKYEGETTRHAIGAYDNIASPVERTFFFVEDDKYQLESGNTTNADYSIFEMTPTLLKLTKSAGATQSSFTLGSNTTTLNAASKVVIDDKFNVSGQATYPGGLEGDIIRLNSHASDADGMYYHDGTSWDRLSTDDYVSANYEPAFTKNTAFNKNFGTIAGTVVQGNDSRLTTAYSHSQINTGNPHNLSLADIGESLSSINYWTKSGDNLSYSGGNVAIGGMPANDHQLVVYGASPEVEIQSTGTGSRRLRLEVDDTNESINLLSSFASGEAYPFNFNTSVGIGTTDVQSLLTLKATSAETSFFRANAADNDAIAFEIGFDGASDNYIVFKRRYSDITYNFMTVDRSNGNISTEGNITASGEVTANTNFKSSDNIAILGNASGTTTTGSVYLRPNGYDSDFNQTEIDNRGDMTVKGDITLYENLIHTAPNSFIIANNSGDGDNIVFRPQGVASSSGEMILGNGGGLGVSGNVVAVNFVLDSDSTLKENIQPLYNDNEIVSFNFKEDTTNRVRYGVIAQELQKKHPEMVHMNQDSTLGVAYTDYLVYKVAKLQNQINELKQGGQTNETNKMPYVNFALIIGSIIFFAIRSRHRNV
jgi:hypothetical protein